MRDRSEYGRRYYLKNRERIILRVKEWYAAHPDAAKNRNDDLGRKRDQSYYQRHREERLAYTREWRKKHRPLKKRKAPRTRDEIGRIYRETWRASRVLALQKLGGACVRCGISNPIVLQIDHVHRTQDGQWVPDLRKNGNASGTSLGLLRRIARDAVNMSEFQLLCANCHSIKTYENDEKSRRARPDKTATVEKEYPQLTLFDLSDTVQ